MYKKVNVNFLKEPKVGWESLKGNKLYSEYKSQQVSLRYYSIDDLDTFKACHMNKFFTIKPDRVTYTTIDGQGFLPPHIDHGYTTVLNYYIQTGNDKTSFYTKKFDDLIGYNYPNKVQANIFKIEDLFETDNFIATNYSAYLLDVSKIHSVSKPNEITRLFISYQWRNHKFLEILKSLMVY